jgi:hypothetical protein
VQEFKKMSDTAYERAYGKAKKELEAEVKRAAKAGDEVGAAAASTELADLEKDKATRDAVKDVTDPVFDAWKSENSAWYEDAEMQEEAELEGYRLAKRMREGKQAKVEGLPFLNLVKDAMKKKFPEKFGNPRRAAGSGVERSAAGGDDTGGGEEGLGQDAGRGEGSRRALREAEALQGQGGLRGSVLGAELGERRWPPEAQEKKPAPRAPRTRTRLLMRASAPP